MYDNTSDCNHRCGDRSPVAQCTSTLSYANAMRGGAIDDEDYDETETEPTPATQAIVHQLAARAADDSATAPEPVAVTETMATTSTTAISVQTVAESATGSTALTATTAPTTAAGTASAIAMSESDVSDRDGDDEHSDGEISTSEEGGSGKDAEGFQQPTVHARRQRRSNKRSAVSVSVSASDTNGRPKKTKAHQNDPNELDPTRRRQSWSKIPTTRRK